MKILITGAAGFIGSHTAASFLSRGDTVIGVDNLSRPGNTTNLDWLSGHACFRFHHADVRGAGDLARIFREHADAKVVVHEAAQVAVTTSVADPRGDFEINALGTFNVLEAARQFTPEAVVIYASTNKVYGNMEHIAVREEPRRYVYADTPQGLDEGEPLDFHSPYGCSKGCAEQYVRDYSRIYGLKSVVFRQSCIYGPRQFGMEDQGWVAWFTIATVLGRPITIYGDGKQVRDILWIEDLVDLYMRAIERIDIAAGEIYNAGGGPANTLSLLELLDHLESLSGRPIEKRFSDWRPGDQKVFVANCGKASRELGWNPSVAPREGVERLLKWVRESSEMIGRVTGPVIRP